MDKWEYKLIDSRHIEKEGSIFKSTRPLEKVEEYLNQLGNEGWEIIDLNFEGLSHDTGTFVGVAKRKR